MHDSTEVRESMAGWVQKIVIAKEVGIQPSEVDKMPAVVADELMKVFADKARQSQLDAALNQARGRR